MQSAEEAPPVDSPFAYGFLRQVVSPMVKILAIGKNSQDAAMMKAILAMAKAKQGKAALWGHHGLGNMVNKAHFRWRERYAGWIRQVVGKYNHLAMIYPALTMPDIFSLTRCCSL